MTLARRYGPGSLTILAVMLAGALWYVAIEVSSQSKRAEQITRNAPAGIVMCSTTSKIAYVNPSICEMTGYRRAELLACGVKLIIPDEYRSQHDEAIDKAFTRWSEGEPPATRMIARAVSLRTKEGEEIPVNIRLSSIKHGPNNIEFIAYITHRHVPEPQGSTP